MLMDYAAWVFDGGEVAFYRECNTIEEANDALLDKLKEYGVTPKWGYTSDRQANVVKAIFTEHGNLMFCVTTKGTL